MDLHNNITLSQQADYEARGRILVIDDNELVLGAICGHLSTLGHTLTTATSCEHALEIIADNEFDLVISDLKMPGIGGLGVLSYIREQQIDTPVVVLSGQSDMATVLEAIREGAFDYVVKDSEPAPLYSAVARALKHIRLTRHNHELLGQLKDINQELERQVHQRTKQLQETNERLSLEGQQLEHALRTLQRTESRLFQADKIATIGMLTAGVAHEINNPLTFLIPNVATVQDWVRAQPTAEKPADELPESRDEVIELLDECVFGLERIRTIVSQLSLFSRRDNQTSERIRVSKLVSTLIQFTSSELRHHANVTLSLDENCFVMACPGQLHQVLLNILVNAARAIPSERNGEIHVSVASDHSKVRIAIQDNGIGISREMLRKIFDPFYTTRRGSEGTGLGLSISLELAKKMGGGIQVDSTPDVGTTMTLELPVAAPIRSSRSKAVTGPVEPHTGPRKRVLLLDDEEPLLRMFRRILSSRHDVEAFSSGQRALAWLRDNPMPDLLVCDIMMPEMNGIEFYKQAIAINADMEQRIVFLTGGAVTRDAQQFLKDRKDRVVLKPLSVAEILDLPSYVES